MNYNQTTIQGESWQRAKKILIINEFEQTPTIEFEEETVAVVGENAIKQPCGNLIYDINNSDSFKLLNPSTGEWGEQTMTMAELRLILTSLYLDKAEQRDGN